MFRNPRDNSSIVVDKTVLPSTGRPPTPPSRERTTRPTASPYVSSDGNANQMSTASSPAKLPIPRKQSATKASDVKRNGFKQNQSILSFFGKAVTTPAGIGALQEDALFFQDPTKQESPTKPVRAYSCHEGQEEKDAFGGLQSSASRFNETENPVKRRKLSGDHFELAVRTPSPEPIPYMRQQSTTLLDGAVAAQTQKQFRHRGGFLDDSDDDNDEEDVENHNLTPANAKSAPNESRQETPAEAALDGANDAVHEVSEITNTTTELLKPQNDSNSTANRVSEAEPGQQSNILPSLNRQGTSTFIPGDFDEADDFENDEFFEGGEEFMERRWMAEQQEMEIDFDEDSKSESDGSVLTLRDNESLRVEEECGAAENACPICNSSLQCLSEIQALSHVNACLDGTATALPALGLTTKDANTKQESTPTALKSSNLDRASSRFFKRAAVARPGQSNPFVLAKEEKTNGGSAFSRLMSGHAEDAAWAEAATNENQSRGKPAYQRTCPFYKIMPGFYIAVDAFRYGKVEGQNAYFLSHFHSDHYIGLTSSWCHGPIYASKVTTNLIMQQLRVDAKWLVPLEFEKKVEVPNTKGVSVTMIPANHCPGSSLYLFEKSVGKNKDGSPRMNRVLHCGDFRACPAHVYHPLLKPDILDTVTGLTKQQMIDTCYLDTTYLTPKYAFPSQHDVIDACAQMCVSLSKEIPDGSDSWERAKLERAGSTMTKFLEIDDRAVRKEEVEEVDVKPKLRGKLLVVIGTYSIGKERICLGIARALGSKIYAPPAKMRICSCLEDEELNSLLTKNPLEAQVHMQTLMEIRAETLHDYLITYKGHFSRVVGFRPTGWSYRPPTSRFTENPAVNTVLHSEGWKSHFTMRDLAPQRGSTKESNCFGVPYSEHSSFRELTMFCCALRIGRVVPTVNVGSAKSREKMKGWIEKWEAEKKRNGLFKVEVGAEGWGSGDGKLRYGV